MFNEIAVHITELHPMRIASVTVTSQSPEQDAVNTLLDWARPQGLLDGAFRFFGYDNCQPHPNHTYTTWLTIDADVKPSGDIAIVNFPGGTFATTDVHGVAQISPAWKGLVEWVRTHERDFGDHPGLEEHLDVLSGTMEHFRLYISLK